MPNGLVLADDATGALECASLLAGMGLAVTITVGEEEPLRPGHGIRVVDTDSRHLPPEEAAARIHRWLAAAPHSALYKKTDSTLRGNIAAELLAILDAEPHRPIVYVPAYPAIGRTVRDGSLYVNGVPVSETDFAADPRNPVRSSFIPDLFLPASRHRIRQIPDARSLDVALSNNEPRILVCDAAADADLRDVQAVLRQIQPRPWLAGPAGFIPLWAALDNHPDHQTPAYPVVNKWLIVRGSMHPQSRRQAQLAEAMGLPVIQASSETFLPPAKVAAEIAGKTLKFIAHEEPEAVLIMGGDTARAIWNSLEIQTLIPLPEILPGIAVCVSPQRRLLFVTKAGGFGDDTLVQRILERFKQA